MSCMRCSWRLCWSSSCLRTEDIYVRRICVSKVKPLNFAFGKEN